MTAKPLDARRAQGLLLAFVLVTSQASAWFHATAISHVACLEHGEAVHGAAIPARGAAAVDPNAAAGVHADLTGVAGHDHCANAALLRWRDVALTAQSALVPARLPSRPAAFTSSRDALSCAVVYLIAPKTSPPPPVA